MMKTGFYVTGSATSNYADLMRQIKLVDDSGFASVWLRERHFHVDHQGRNFFSAPLVMAAAIAAQTRHIRIGMGAKILPLHHPLHLAEDAATVDILSGGRFDFGIARIGENQQYQDAFGIRPDEVRGRFEECIDIITMAWKDEPFSFQGRYYTVPEISVYPKPVQQPHPPIYLVGISDSTLSWGAQRGYPLLLAGAQTETIVNQTQEKYRKLLAAAGRDQNQTIINPVNRFIYVGETNQQAIEDTREMIMEFIHRDNSVIRDFFMLPPEAITYDLLFNEVCIFGDPDYCLERITKLQARIDLREVLFTFNYFTISHEKCCASMARFIHYVLPELLRSRGND